MSWNNADGLYIEHGRENVRKTNRAQSVKQFGSTSEIQIKFDLGGMTAGTKFPADLNNDGTMDGFTTAHTVIPDQAVIESAVIYMTDEAAAGGTSVAVGTFQVNGTAIDADGLVTAVNGATADLIANARVAGTGAQVATGVTQAAYIALVTVGTFTAGKGTLIIKYTLPQTA